MDSQPCISKTSCRFCKKIDINEGTVLCCIPNAKRMVDMVAPPNREISLLLAEVFRFRETSPPPPSPRNPHFYSYRHGGGREKSATVSPIQNDNLDTGCMNIFMNGFESQVKIQVNLCRAGRLGFSALKASNQNRSSNSKNCGITNRVTEN